MILIADSGSTKTDWKCTEGSGKVGIARTGGINPYFLESDAITEEIFSSKKQLGSVAIDTLYFYGAGCSTTEQKDFIKSKLLLAYSDARISVNSDLLGAARALCQHEPGIACILGTGSGSCVYNGEDIVYSIPSLGFILGDEGSGAYLGKQLIRDFLREEMPQELVALIATELGLSKDLILKNVNRIPMPSKYLAQFSKFIYRNINEPYIEKLLENSFNDFLDKYVVRYKEAGKYEIHFVGSIALNFQKILEKCLHNKNLVLGRVEDAPINRLLDYHL